FMDYHFDETIFLSIGKNRVIIVSDKPKLVEIFSWNEQNLSYLDPRTSEYENVVNRIIHLQNIANRLPGAFNYSSNITKSHILTVNTPARIVVINEHATINDNNTIPHKRRESINESTNQMGPSEHAPDESVELNTLEKTIIKITNPVNIENPLNYCNEIWDQNEIIIDDIFSFSVAQEIINNL
ncbi:hypothetical protein Pfo_013961, partial [Paulownia fortunei]